MAIESDHHRSNGLLMGTDHTNIKWMIGHFPEKGLRQKKEKIPKEVNHFSFYSMSGIIIAVLLFVM